MNKQNEPKDLTADRSLHDEYERIKDTSRSEGAHPDQAKRDAARAVHRRRRAERIPDTQEPPA
jgi:hypothetical protein